MSGLIELYKVIIITNIIAIITIKIMLLTIILSCNYSHKYDIFFSQCSICVIIVMSLVCHVYMHIHTYIHICIWGIPSQCARELLDFWFEILIYYSSSEEAAMIFYKFFLSTQSWDINFEKNNFYNNKLLL